MRLAAIACGLLMVMGAAVFGAILVQRSPLPIASSTPVEASAAAETTARSVVTTLEERAVPSALIATEKTTHPAESAENKPVVVAQTPPVAAAQTQLPPITPTTPLAISCAGNPNALGVSRVVEIDTTGGPGFGMEHFK